MKGFTYHILRSNRKSLSIQVKPEGITVKAPLTYTDAHIRKFVTDHAGWIEKQLTKIEARTQAVEAAGKLSMEEIRALANKARDYIPRRVAYYAPKVGVTYGRITIRNQRSRWGSCSEKGNLNFNCLLMLTSPEVIDSVVVHELCHRKEMNHSAKFYDEVLKIYPDYPKCDKWLKDNGGILMARMQ